MKYLLTACFFFFVTTQMVLAQKCIMQDECDEGQCCCGIPPYGGFCSNFTAEGGKCHVVDKTVPIFGDFYIVMCPCEEGLVCIQQGKKKNDGICQLPPTTPAPIVIEEKPTSLADNTPAKEPAVDDTPAEEPVAGNTSVEKPSADDTPAEEPAAEAGDSSASDSAAEAV